jgi:cytochrome c553
LEPLAVPGSDRRFTEAQLRNLFDVPDWHPDRHPAMPEIVAKGREPAVYACGFCHLPDGQGRVENAPVAGLPVNYIIAQVRALRSGERRSAWPDPWRPFDLMHAVALAVSEEDLRSAANYFSAVPLSRRAIVTEAERIPKMRVAGVMYVATPGAALEPLGERIIEVAEDQERHERRDATVSYRAYVPPGSIDAGRRLAEGDAGAGRMACRTCHGEELRGSRLAPPIAGRSPTYLLRQLIAFRTGARAGMAGAPMQPVAAMLSLRDMISVAAYAGSLPP